MNRVGVILSILAMLLVLVAAHSRGWRSGRLAEGDLHIDSGLLDASVCTEDGCRELAWTEVGGRARSPTTRLFVASSGLTYVLVWACVFALGLALVVARRFGIGSPARVAAMCSGLLTLSAIVATVSWPWGGAEAGWAAFMAMAGGLLGIFGAAHLMLPPDDYSTCDGSEVLRREGRPYPSRPYPLFSPNPIVLPPEDPTRRNPLRNESDLDRRSTELDTRHGMLPFVASQVQITADGLEVTDHGSGRSLRWEELSQLRVRKLPPDPPLSGGVLLDLIAVDQLPIRLLATTRANYGALPGGGARTSIENFRHLVRLATSRQPALFNADLGRFLEGAIPERLRSVRELRAIDSAYWPDIRAAG